MLIRLSVVSATVGVLVGLAGHTEAGQPTEALINVQGSAAESVRAWGSSLSQDPRISMELLRFGGGGPLTPAYAGRFSREVRSEVISSAGQRVSELLAGDCMPSVNVTIGEWKPSSPANPQAGKEEGKAIEAFEGSLIRTEMVACLPGVEKEPGAVLELYTSPEFRMAAEDRIREIWDSPDGSCIETKGAYGLVDPTRVCNKITELRGDVLAAQHSQVVFNEGVKPYQTVFFKESLKTFVRTADGMALHYVNFTRTTDLNRMERWVGAGRIRSAEEGMVDLLRARLRDPAGG